MKRALSACILLFCLVFLPSCGSTSSNTPVADLPRPTNWENLLATHVYEGLLASQETIDMTKLGFAVMEEDLRLVFSSLLASQPDLFFVSQEYTLKKEGDTLLYMRPQYLFEGQARLNANTSFDTALLDILEPVTPNWSQLEIVLYLHDYLITHFSYDESLTVYNPYEMLSKGEGVCQAYALLFKALCQKAGVACEVVLCFPKQHEWNMVKLNNNWYHIDLTWDETELPYLGRVPHTYCLLDDTTLRARRAAAREDWQDAYGWDAPHTATDNTFALLPLGDCYGTVSVGTGSLYFATAYEVWAVDVHTFSATPIFIFPAGEQANPFVTLVTHKGDVYFNLSNSIWRISLPTQIATPLGAPLTGTGERYYGLAVVNNILVCQTKKR